MPSGKAQYTGHCLRREQFKETLKQQLRDYHPDLEAETEPYFEHPADTFVKEVLAAVQSATLMPSQSLTRQDIAAEQINLLRMLTDTIDKLRNLSGDFDRLLGQDADPLGCADSLAALIPYVEVAAHKIDNLPAKKKPTSVQHAIATELAHQVLPILAANGISTAATADPDLRQQSEAVEILQLIGNDIKIVRSTATWRDIIAATKAVTHP